MVTALKKQRVLLVDLGASMGGVEAYLEALAKILAPNTELFALCVLSELAERLKQTGARVTLIPIFARFRFLRFLTAIGTMSYLLIRHSVDVVQINGFLESILLVPARLLGRQTVYTRHGPFEMDLFPWYKHPFKYMPRLLSRYGAHLSSRLVCVSETVGSLCIPLFPKGRVTVIPNWITNLPDPRIGWARRGEVTKVVYIGRLERYKGVHLLIEATRDLENVEVTIVGDGTYRRDLEKLSQGASVRFVGFQRDPKPFYQSADIFVLPSLGPEGLPMVAIEAMSYMLPCVFSDLLVNREITENGRAAMLFRCGDVLDLREKLAALLNNESERARIAKSAYDLVKKKYHEPIAREAYLQVFSAVESPLV